MSFVHVGRQRKNDLMLIKINEEVKKMKERIIAAMLALLLMLPVISAIQAPFSPSFYELRARIDKYFEPFISGQLYVVTSYLDISYPGDTFQHTFTLTNLGTVTLPELDETDGTVTRIYKTHRMYDQAGNAVQEGSFEEIVTALAASSTTSYTIQLPVETGTPSGDYASTAVLFKISQTWDRTTNTWALGEPVVLDKQGVTFNVQTPTPAPTPSPATLLGKIASLFAGILAWIIGLFS